MIRRVVVVALLLVPSVARADDARVSSLREAIEVSSPRCIEVAPLAAQVASWLQTETIDDKLHVIVSGDPSASVSFVVERGRETVGRRSFRTQGMSCPNVNALVSLAIAMAIDASPVTSREDPLPPPPEIRREPRHAPRSQGSLRSPLQWALGLEMAVLLGVLQRPALSGGLVLGLGLSDHLWIRAAAWQTTTARSTLGPGEVATSLSAIEASICVAIPAPPALFRACGGFTLGRLVATGRGFDIPATTDFAWPAPTFRFDATIHVRGAFHVVFFVSEMSALPRGPELDVVSGQNVLNSTTLPSTSLAFGLGPMLQFE